MAASVNKSEVIRGIIGEHPEFKDVQVVEHAKQVHKLKINRGNVSNVRAVMKRKALGLTAGEALSKFKATRATQKRRGALPGGDPAAAPFRTAFEVDERGVEIALRNGHGRIGTLEISPVGLVFVEGKGVRSTERCIPWNLLSSLQGFAGQTEGGD